MPKEYVEQHGSSINFYRDKLRTLNILGIILLSIVMLLVIYASLQILSIQEPTYFATTDDGRLIKLQGTKY